jgi:hypothetical protein
MLKKEEAKVKVCGMEEPSLVSSWMNINICMLTDAEPCAKDYHSKEIFFSK